MASTEMQMNSINRPTMVQAATLIILASCAIAHAAPSTRLSLGAGNQIVPGDVTVSTYAYTHSYATLDYVYSRYDVRATAHSQRSFYLWAEFENYANGHPGSTQAVAVTETTVNDLIFTALADPNATGFVDVKLRFRYEKDSFYRDEDPANDVGISGNVQVKFGTTPTYELRVWTDGIGTGESDFVTVPLNTPITLVIYCNATEHDAVVRDPYLARSIFSFDLAQTPFAFSGQFGANGYTAESVDLGVTNNTLPPLCGLPGDMDSSGFVDSKDIEGFTRAKLGSPAMFDAEDCADYETGTLDGDVAAFVSDLLAQ